MIALVLVDNATKVEVGFPIRGIQIMAHGPSLDGLELLVDSVLHWLVDRLAGCIGVKHCGGLVFLSWGSGEGPLECRRMGRTREELLEG